MNCANHPDVAASAYCRSCGKALCRDCERPAQGTVYCQEHAPAAEAPPPAAYSPYTTPYAASTGSGVSPGLAFLLGLLPGVGAIYNGQYAKGLVHVVILGLLFSIANSGASDGLEPLFVFLIIGWFFYMAFEAYHTARRRERGEAVDEFSSIMPIRKTGFPAGPVILIVLGVVFLLNTLDVVRLYQILKYWPVFLIALGIYLLYVRITAPAPEARNEP